MEENTLNTQSVEFEYGNKTVKIETGKVARQATSSIIVTIDNLVLLTTMVARKEADPRKDFFPLAVFYQEKFQTFFKTTKMKHSAGWKSPTICFFKTKIVSGSAT